jgi:hypothetical protein
MFEIVSHCIPSLFAKHKKFWEEPVSLFSFKRSYLYTEGESNNKFITTQTVDLFLCVVSSPEQQLVCKPQNFALSPCL